MNFLESFQNLHKTLYRRQFNGVRYVFGPGFRNKENLADIFKDLERRHFSPKDAKRTIEDVLVACDYGKFVKDIPVPLQRSFVIGNHGEKFDLQEIAEMQERALFVKISDNLDEGEKWLEFLYYLVDYKHVENEPKPDDDVFDELRELSNRKKLDFRLVHDILSLMEERKLLDVLNDYTEETGKSVIEVSITAAIN